MKKFRVLFCVLLSGLLISCASTSTDDVEVPLADDAFKLYEKSQTSMKAGNYQSAIQHLEQLDSLYPFGPYSHQAQTSLIYAYYMARDSASAISAAERFIRQNPNHDNVDYAYYMKGLTNFTAEVGFFKELLSADLSQRDASTARQAFSDFAELLRKYPNSSYAKDAQKRMIFLRNRLASYELHVARYYMERSAYIAAANRAQYIVENYPKTTAIPDALVVMATAYDLLNLSELSEKAKNVLKLNYPEYAAKL
ncbi:outer membrane protein assembly factor BamD [Pleionea mediterranea]|jgi:outer membrane protein assembly factor BamD|uniref:Outer membrane protein assembly factor BamD n=1 Tax=Pleionea mediterranea TaxID=523701 RepID=A0A316FC19_9GAMM|nr:outer membrane protein assembly factor BamD [Pleionea mediterranea]PWK44446.1 Beta-barrel assembly machine subunit BamD [Pleionea mediterranea]